MPDYDPKSIPILDDVIEADILEQADAEDKHKAPIADITDMEDVLSIDDGTVNLFSTAPVELGPQDVIIEDSTADASLINELDAGDTGPSIGTLESLGDSPADAVVDTSQVNTDVEDTSPHHARADKEENEAEHFDEESFESALIDYQSDAEIVKETSDQQASEAGQAAHEQQPEIEEVTDSVIEQPATLIETQPTQAVQTTQATQEATTLTLDDIVDDVVNDIVSQLLPDLRQQLRHLVQQALEDRLPAELISQDKPGDDHNHS